MSDVENQEVPSDTAATAAPEPNMVFPPAPPPEVIAEAEGGDPGAVQRWHGEQRGR